MTRFILAGLCVLIVSCQPTTTPQAAVSGPRTIELTYSQTDIQKDFDTLYNNQQIEALVAGDSTSVYAGFLEQALAHAHQAGSDTGTVTQDVVSSMYFNRRSGQYDCVTNTTFQFPDGSITASGIFNLIPGDTIAPDHDFPVTGGSGIYSNTYGTYTRHYANGLYSVRLSLRPLH